MIWFVISIILLLFSAAVTGVALSNNVKGAGIGLIPGLVGLLLLIPACLYSVDVGEVAAKLEEARRLKREAAHDDDTRIIAMLCEELDRQQSDLSRRSGSANPATARDTRGESLRKEQNGELEWVDDERRGPMLKPAVPKRSHMSPPSDA